MRASELTEVDGLLRDVARRDRRAFKRLYELTAPKLFGIVLRIVRHRPAAEEVLQDVYLRIWQSAETFSPQTATGQTWLNSIARNRAIDVLRQRRFTTVSGSGDAADLFERIAEDRDREADMINAASLTYCLGQLDEDARTCVLLAYCEGYSREEIAQRFGRPVNTIKTWLHRNLASLRSCLGGSSA